MIQIINYAITNGEKSEPITFDKILNSKEELEELRKFLEEKEKCWEENRTITGVERKKVREIVFTYKES